MLARRFKYLPHSSDSISRRFYCIHPVVVPRRNRTELTASENTTGQLPLSPSQKRFGQEYADKVVSIDLLLESLRNMQAYRTVKPEASCDVQEYKSAVKAILQLKLKSPGTVSIAQLEEIVSPENEVTWSLTQNLLLHGNVPELERLNEQDQAAVLFARVHGIGRIFATTFAQNGARTLDDLILGDEKRKKGVGSARKLSNAQLLGIAYLEDMDQMIPRAEIDVIRERFEKALALAGSSFQYEIMGSYRRGESASSDVDIVVYHPSYRQKPPGKPPKFTDNSLLGLMKSAMLQTGFIENNKILNEGPRKMTVLTRINRYHRQCDIRLCPLDSVPYMLVGNTGDMQLMKILRTEALKKKWTLNEYEMGPFEKIKGFPVLKAGQGMIVKDERGIFKHLGLPYLEPTQRSFKTYSKLPVYSELIGDSRRRKLDG